MQHPARLRFGGVTLDTTRGVLAAAGGTETTLRPKTLELALLLLRNPGRVVSRAEILDTVWPGVFVTDDSVTQCVVELRRAMGADAAALKTVPKRGYLLEAEVEVSLAMPPRLLVKPAPSPPDRPAPAARPGGWWAPRATALAGAAALLGWLAWPSAPPPPPATLAPPPALLAAAPTPPTPEPPSAEDQARLLVEEGRRVMRGAGPIQQRRIEARALFERAVALDPRNVRALAEAAVTYTNAILAGDSTNPAADLAAAQAHAERAYAINPGQGASLTVMAAVLRLQRRHAEALDFYERAVARDPSAHASRANIGFMRLMLGQGEDAAAPVLASLAAEPSLLFAGTWNTYLGLIALHLGEGDHGVARLRTGLDHDAFMPRPERLTYLVAALQLSGEAAAAQALAREIAARHPWITQRWFGSRALSDHPTYRTQFARILAALDAAGLPE